MSDFSSAAFCATFATFLGSEREKKMDDAQKAVRKTAAAIDEREGELFRDNISCGVGEREFVGQLAEYLVTYWATKLLLSSPASMGICGITLAKLLL